MVLHRDISGHHGPQVRERRPGSRGAGRGKRALHGEARGEVVAERRGRRPGRLLHPHRAGARRGGGKHVPEAHSLHTAPGEVLQPGGVDGLVPLAVGGGGQAAVAQPHLHVLGGVKKLALDDPEVQAGPERRHAFAPVLARVVLPVGEQHGAPAAREVLRQGREDLGEEAVPATCRLVHSALAGGACHRLAVLHHGQPRLVRGGRSDDERRIGDDEIEPLPRHRLEQRALAQVPLVTGELRVKAREREGARRDVRGRNGLCVPGEQRGLNPAAGAQIEDAPHGRARRHARERQGGPAHPEHVVRGHGAPGHPFAEVRREPHVTIPHLNRAEVDSGCPPAVVGGSEDADGGGTGRGEIREGAIRLGVRDGVAQHEEAGEDRGRGGARAGGAQSRGALLAGERG